MNKETILQGYNDLMQAKKHSALAMKLIAGFAFLVVLSVLIWAFLIHQRSIGQIKVVRTDGSILPSTLQKQEKFLKTRIKTHCAQAVYFLNSFDRFTIKENQAKAYFLVNKPDADLIFSKYQKNKNYGDALDRGITYQTEFKELISLNTEQEPYHVIFESILNVYGDKKEQFLIKSQGDIISYTAQYPENIAGLFFKNYTQEYQKIKEE